MYLLFFFTLNFTKKENFLERYEQQGAAICNHLDLDRLSIMATFRMIVMPVVLLHTETDQNSQNR